jgi:hypothetical protein
MKIFIAGSKYFYEQMEEVIRQLEEKGHEITLPNSFDEPFKEEDIKKLGLEKYYLWKSEQFNSQNQKVSENDAVLVFNLEKNGFPNYVGGATFLEMFKAWELGKKIFLLNEIPENILEDEIKGFNPVILNGDLSKIR